MRGAVLINILVLAGVAAGQVPDGYEMLRLTEFGGSYSRPDLNNRGEMIWADSHPPDVSNIMLFSRGIVRQLTDDTYYDIQPRINDHGDYTHLIAEDFFGVVDVTWNIAGQTTVYDAMNAANAHPDINNAGQIVWDDKFSDNASDQPVFLFNGKSVQQISDNGLCNHTPRINNSGQIVFDVTDIKQVGGPSTMVLFEDGVLIPLTDNEKARAGISINDTGQIIWSESNLNGSNRRIMLWEDGIASVFEDGEVVGAELGNNGDVAYLEWNETLSLHEMRYYRSSDKAFFQLPSLGMSHSAWAGMNECGELVWRARDVDSGQRTLLMVRRIGPQGDFDHDCRIDARDYAILEHCYTGSDAGPADGLLADCTRADFDGDCDVDQDDVAAFNLAVTGPSSAVPDCEAIELCGP